MKRTVSIVAAAVLLCVGLPLPAGVNEDQPWFFYTNGTGNLGIAGEELDVVLIDPGTNSQIYQRNLALEGGTEYRLTFSGSSNRGQDVNVGVRKHGAPYTLYGLWTEVDLSTRESYHELVFTTTPGDKVDARLQFYFSPYDRPGDRYAFEDISLEKVGGEDGDEEDTTEFEEADLLFELNDTDGDLGFHGLVDGGPWIELSIETPNGAENIEVELASSAGAQGLTELFFESAEPTFDELDPAEFFARFPEGVYEISGTSIDGEELESEDELFHLLPAPPSNIAVNGAPVPEDCDEGPVPTVSGDVVVTWDEVSLSHPELGRTNEPIEIELYEVVIELIETELTLSYEVTADVTEVEIPASMFGDGGEIKIEILAREESGNQTATESCFEVD